MQCYIVDYVSYSEKGFFFTESNSVNFDYKPMGSIYVKMSSGYSKEKIQRIDSTFNFAIGDYEYSNRTEFVVDYERAVIGDAIRVLYDNAVKMGANGIINLEFGVLPQYEIYAKGMAIKR
jgi:hypothetical protein